MTNRLKELGLGGEESMEATFFSLTETACSTSSSRGANNNTVCTSFLPATSSRLAGLTMNLPRNHKELCHELCSHGTFPEVWFLGTGAPALWGASPPTPFNFFFFNLGTERWDLPLSTTVGTCWLTLLPLTQGPSFFLLKSYLIFAFPDFYLGKTKASCNH